jgi:hypothetical protein
LVFFCNNEQKDNISTFKKTMVRNKVLVCIYN